MTLKRRNAAKQALLQAETDRKLRRAMLRKYQGTNLPLEVGQLCFFWRDAKAADLGRFAGMDLLVWLPERTRIGTLMFTDLPGRPNYFVAVPITSDRTTPRPTPKSLMPKLAVKDVQTLKSRGMTRYLDLNRINR